MSSDTSLLLVEVNTRCTRRYPRRESSQHLFNSTSLGEMLSPVQQLRRRISHSGAAFRAVFANPGLRNLELAWALAILGQWAFVVAVSIYAFGAGGAQAVGLIILLRFGLAALTAPF